MDFEPDVPQYEQEQRFHDAVRHSLLTIAFFVLLYAVAWTILSRYIRRLDAEDYFSGQDEDALVYRISLFLCCFSLSISLGAVSLVPISILSNEVLTMYPNSYYVQWLNSTLISGVWDWIFLFSNTSLFLLLPFAYLFTESEGFIGSRKGLMARVYETIIVLALMVVLVLGLAWVVSAILDNDTEQTQKAFFDLWSFYLPALYSCISFFGVALLLVCTPLGFTRLFSIAGDLLRSTPIFSTTAEVNERANYACHQVESIRARLAEEKLHETSYMQLDPSRSASLDNVSSQLSSLHRRSSASSVPVSQQRSFTHQHTPSSSNGTLSSTGGGYIPNGSPMPLRHQIRGDGPSLEQQLSEARSKQLDIEQEQAKSSLRRNLFYPLAIILVMSLTLLCLTMVVLNILQLLVGHRSTVPTEGEGMVLGAASLSMFGLAGATVEIVLILYITLVSLIGCYSLPLLGSRLEPRPGDSSLTQLIANACLLLVLSSALPVLSRIIGLTDFDLLGNYGRIEWLRSLYIVLLYNVTFAVLTALCLTNLATRALRNELLARLGTAYQFVLVWHALHKSRKSYALTANHMRSLQWRLQTRWKNGQANGSFRKRNTSSQQSSDTPPMRASCSPDSSGFISHDVSGAGDDFSQ